MLKSREKRLCLFVALASFAGVTITTVNSETLALDQSYAFTVISISLGFCSLMLLAARLVERTIDGEEYELEDS